MKILGTSLLLLFALSTCTTSGPRFHNMTPAELMAYNRTVEYPDQVHCTDEVTTGSHISRKECATYREMAEGKVRALNTPSSSSSIARPF